jgi:hypothetical protein
MSMRGDLAEAGNRAAEHAQAGLGL